ncbi:MAG TPA: alpha/beta hydrolase-fold protein, partial [Ktedonobacterales bacterium]|nr:alpha/beta hydrolase-fold protein [Ktedonobacterales bacterium]
PNDATRRIELACHTLFIDFLAQELLPWMHAQYRVSRSPVQTIVGGMSLGGLAAAYAGLRRPDLFGQVFTQSGSLFWKPEQEVEYEWVTRQLVAAPQLPLRWYVSVGLLETHPHEGARPNLLLANRHLRDVLYAKGYPVRYAEFNGGHDFVWQLPCLAEGLQFLLSQ